MALRSLASNVLPVFGLRLQPLAVEFSQTVARTFATVVAPEYKYATSHEWARLEDGTAAVGISDFAQKELGDVVFVDLPEVGATVVKGESFAAIESVKAASDIYAPVSGEVTEVNSDLAEQPDAVNIDPYGDGWLVKIKMSNPSDADSLLDAAAYSKQLE